MLTVQEHLLDQVTETIYRILKGEKPPPVELPADYPENEFQQMAAYFNRLVAEYNEFADFMYSMARGELDYQPPKGKMRVVQSFKSLQASLRHLTWKTQQIANGDLDQQVDFMGDFAQAFNAMTRQLKQAFADVRREKERSDELLKNITASIQYAQLIQSALLPRPDSLQAYLADSFWLWLPRDIVGGDLYYMEACPAGGLLAVLDCTGHGVPGALMTMLASSGLRKIIQDEACQTPAEILKRLNILIKTTLRQDTAAAPSDDGLDAAICLIQPQAQQLIFAGAHLPLYYIQEGVVNEIKGDRQSLGYKRSDEQFGFTSHTVTLRPNMMFYLCTDGLRDQVGGERGLPFGSKRLKLLLQEQAANSCAQQKATLFQAFQAYKGAHDRRDDVTAVGFKVRGVGENYD